MLSRGVKHPPMPPNPAPYLTDRLLEIGIVENTGMGIVPLSWGEINEWSRATHVRLLPWEARLIKRLSAAYAAELALAVDEHRPPPWRAGVTKAEVSTEVAGLLALLNPQE